MGKRLANGQANGDKGGVWGGECVGGGDGKGRVEDAVSEEKVARGSGIRCVGCFIAVCGAWDDGIVGDEIGEGNRVCGREDWVMDV